MKTRKAIYSVIGATISIASLQMAGCGDSDNDSVLAPGLSDTLSAIAAVRGYSDSALRGTVWFRQDGDSVRVTAAVAGLEPGKAYAIHVHQFGDCSAPEASGGHFFLDTEMHGNPFDSLPAHHRGDLPNLTVGPAGLGQMAFASGTFSLESGDSASILGRSVVVHANADDYVTQPAGNSGDRIACGVIVQGNVADTTKATDTTGTNNPGVYGPGTTGVLPGNE
jgi:Cu-Zn family superoxide dismutase